jgi:hypothetical protein
LLREFDFEPLFIDALGWDRHNQTLSVVIDGETYALKAISQKTRDDRV